MDKPLLDIVAQTCLRYALLPSGGTLLAAVSGGQDSVAMLLALQAIAGSHGPALQYVHVNHCLRGTDSDRQAAYVEELCRDLGIPGHTIRRDVIERIERTGESIEAAARAERMDAITAVRQEIGASVVALGHTADDRVETILMNIIRGAGAAGLAAMPARRGPIIRPCIETDRAMTGAFCAECGVTPFYDSSNRDVSHRRNRIRHELLPYLEAYHNRSVRAALLRLGDLARSEDGYMEELTEAFLRDIPIEPDSSIHIDRTRLAALHPALQRRVVRRIYKRVTGNADDLGAAMVEHVVRAIQTTGIRRTWTTPSGVRFQVDERLQCFRPIQRADRIDDPIELPVPGEVFHQASGLRFSAEPFRVDTIPSALDSHTLVLPATMAVPPLVIRSPRPGDRLRPLGLQGSKKLGDCCTDRRIPVTARLRLAVVSDKLGILWVPGVVADERIRVTRTPCDAILVRCCRSM